MGIETDANETFSEMAVKILTIESGIDTTDATAYPDQILDGKIAYGRGEQLVGTMPNNGAVSPSALNCGGSYTIPAGYHNGSGKITANSLASQTSANATAALITKGYTAWVKGVKITGTRPAPVTKNSGSFSFSVNPGDTIPYQVDFSNAFDSTGYTITFTVTSGYYASTMTMTVKTKLTTSCIVNCYNSHPSANATGTISWVAEAI